jgi:hypothetical protein
MTPALKYTLGRLGLFLAVFLVMLPIPALSLPVKALVALLVSMPLAWFALRRWRDQTSVAIATGIERRRARRERLRAALAGEDEPTANDPDRPGPD